MKSLLLLSPLALLAAAGLWTASARVPADDQPSAERGRYLVEAMGCHDCHTPWTIGPDGPAPDRTRALSGHPEGLALPPAPALPPGPWTVVVAGTNTAWAGPWGTSFTANLTPDPETGLGSWTPEQFVAAIRSGRHLGRGREILPPMPWPMIRNLSDTDLVSIFLHLRTLAPIRNRVPEPLPPVAAAEPREQ